VRKHAGALASFMILLVAAVLYPAQNLINEGNRTLLFGRPNIDSAVLAGSGNRFS